jgi:hypothetical protein
MILSLIGNISRHELAHTQKNAEHKVDHKRRRKKKKTIGTFAKMSAPPDAHRIGTQQEHPFGF